jgi:hypothetical protein
MLAAVPNDGHVRDRIAVRNREHSVALDPHAAPSIWRATTVWSGVQDIAHRALIDDG